MVEVVKRGFHPKDEKEFGNLFLPILNKAGEEIFFLQNRNYDMKSASTFVGNHYMLSERQRLALTRVIASRKQVLNRRSKELQDVGKVEVIHIDGFNTIITMEVALSGSLLLKGLDGNYRDLAGLRGNYRIVDKTILAVKLMLKTLKELDVKKVIIYLDKPVSNSGRLKVLIYEIAMDYPMDVQVEVINEVDRVLEVDKTVITSDGIILDRCFSWFNLNKMIIEEYIKNPFLFQLDMEIAYELYNDTQSVKIIVPE